MTSDLELLSRYLEHDDRAAVNELFARHYPSVYHTVLKLVHHEAVARDLTQNTFLKVLKAARSFEAPGKFRNWILAIALNEVRQHWRSPRQTRLPDELEALFEELRQERPDHAASRRELERAVESALEKLPEKLKVPLVLHYYEELSLAEIGDLLGMPKSAVQRRCDSALERLRKVFQREGYSALLPLFIDSFKALDPALRKTLSRPTPALFGAGFLGVLSQKSILPAAAAVLLAALAAFVLVRRAAAPTPPGETAAVRSAAPSSRTDRNELPATRSPAKERTREEDAATADQFESDGPGSITGMVVRLPDYAPVARAKVEIAPSTKAFRNSTWTREDGRFDCRRLPLGETYRVLVTHPVLGYQERGALPLGDFQRTLDTGAILMDKGLRVRGVVQTDDGIPLSGAVVRVGNAGCTGDSGSGDLAEIQGGLAFQTDAAGRFELGPLSQGYHDLQFLKAGYARKDFQGFWIPPGGLASDLEIHLEPGGQISGVVLDEAGKPVPAAKISGGILDRYQRLSTGILSSHFLAAATASEEGRFRMEGLPSGRKAVALHVRAEGYLPFRMETAAPASDLKIVLRSVRGPCAFGLRLWTPDPQEALSPAPGSFVLEPEDGGFSYRGEVDEKEGSVEFSSLAAGTYRLDARIPGFRGFLQGFRVEGSRFTVNLKMRPLPAAFTLYGVVLDEETRLPIPHAVIEDGFGAVRLGGADERGVYSFTTDDGDPAVSFIDFMSARAEGYQRRIFTVKFPAKGNEIAMDLPLAKTCTLVEVKGRVIDPAGNPVPGCEVRLPINGSGGEAGIPSRSQLTDLEGRFVLPKIPADALESPSRFELRHPEFPKQSFQVPRDKVLEGQTFRLLPGSLFSGRVLDENGKPVPDALVLAFKEDCAGQPLKELRYTEAIGSVRCDHEGRFTFPTLTRESLLFLPSENAHSIPGDFYPQSYLFTPGLSPAPVTLRLKAGAYPDR